MLRLIALAILLVSAPPALAQARDDPGRPERLANAPPEGSGVTVRDAWVRLPAVAGRPAAGYMTLAATRPARLVSAVSPLAARIELHNASMAGGVMRMDKLPAVELRPGAPFAFKPGGAHLMLYGVSKAAKRGGTLPVTLRFADGATLKVDAMLHAADEAHGGGHH